MMILSRGKYSNQWRPQSAGAFKQTSLIVAKSNLTVYDILKMCSNVMIYNRKDGPL